MFKSVVLSIAFLPLLVGAGHAESSLDGELTLGGTKLGMSPKAEEKALPIAATVILDHNPNVDTVKTYGPVSRPPESPPGEDK